MFQVDIADGLLKMLSQILVQKPRPGTTPPVPSSPVHHQSNANIVLALKTLGCFDFEGTSDTFLFFAQHICETYLNSGFKEIRLEAVPTCLHLIRPMFNTTLTGDQVTQPYNLFKIVQQVLWVCVVDSGKSLIFFI